LEKIIDVQGMRPKIIRPPLHGLDETEGKSEFTYSNDV